MTAPLRNDAPSQTAATRASDLARENAALRSEVDRLRQELATMRCDKADLEVELETIVEHSDIISEQLQDKVEQTLRDSAKRFRAIAEAMPVPIAIHRIDDGTLVYTNQRAATLFGQSERQLMGQAVMSLLFDPRDRDRLKAQLEARGEVQNFELQVKRADGSPVWVSASVEPLDYNDEPALMSAFHDISDRKRIEQLKDEFLANTSHELRTPLNGIIGIAESLMDGAAGPLGRSAVENLAAIASSGRRLATLIDDILDFSKLKNKDLTLQRKAVSLRDATALVLTLSAPLVRGKSLELVNAIDPNLPPALADENRLLQILHNLVGNAIKFTERGRVEVSAAVRQVRADEAADAAPDCAAIAGTPAPDPPSDADPEGHPAIARPLAPGRYLAATVSDTGIGIPPEARDRIFESFEQADGSTARRYGGTGLGLALTRQLVELHGGRIEVESEPDRGSRFTVWLPLADGTAAPPEAQSPARPLPLVSAAIEPVPVLPAEPIAVPVSEDRDATPGDRRPRAPRDGLRILIADDDPVNQQVLVNYLSLQSYAIDCASSGPEVLRIVAEGPRPDLILLDVMMPRMTGYEVCQRLRETHPASELPVILLTAKDRVEDRVTGLECGANDYLSKPVEKSELLARIKTHLEISKTNLAYSRFVPREFLKFLGRDSILDVRLGDQVQKTMAVLFADIRAFTNLSERMTPQENFAFINGFLGRVSPPIRQHGGFVDKYIGDAVMALFPESAESALRAAIAMQEQVAHYNRQRCEGGCDPIVIGIGIHAGNLMLGTIGDGDRLESTVISDAVNLASRLEGLTKLYRSPILISGAAFFQIDDPSLYHKHIRFLGQTYVKGKQQPVPIFEVFATEPSETRLLKRETRSQFEQAVLLFHGRRVSEARTRFQQVLRENPDDRAAEIYLERCQSLQSPALQNMWEKLENL